MARNRNTQRKNRNRNRSRRNKVHRGGAISCNNARTILANPNSSMVKKMAAKVQMKVCNSQTAKAGNNVGGATKRINMAAPNKRFYNYRSRQGEYAKCGAEGVNSNGRCINGGIMPEYVE